MDAKTAQNIIETERLGGATSSATVVMLAQEWLAHEAQVAELEKLLHDLTPMGSEFVGQPEKCAKWIEDHISNLTNWLVTAKGDNTALRQQVTGLRAEVGRLRVQATAFALQSVKPND
jgi:hypothetical protein